MGTIGIGFRIADLEAIRALLEHELGIGFELRDSSYKGEYYAYPPFSERQMSSEAFELRKNIDFIDFPERQNPEWPDIPDCKVVLLIENSIRASGFQYVADKLNAQMLSVEDFR